MALVGEKPAGRGMHEWWKSTGRFVSAGGIIGVVTTATFFPFDTFKVRMQVQTANADASLGTVARTILRNEGVAGLFKGVRYPLASVGVVKATQFGVFGTVKTLLQEVRFGPNLDIDRRMRADADSVLLRRARARCFSRMLALRPFRRPLSAPCW